MLSLLRVSIFRTTVSVTDSQYHSQGACYRNGYRVQIVASVSRHYGCVDIHISAEHATYSYVQTLETRVKRMEYLVAKVRQGYLYACPSPCSIHAVIFQLCPTAEASEELNSHSSDNGLILTMPTMFERSLTSVSRVESPVAVTPSMLTIPPPAPGPDDHDSPKDEEEVELDTELTTSMRKLSMQSQPFRYHGKSSGLVFIRSAMALKNEYSGSRSVPKSDAHHPVSAVAVHRISRFGLRGSQWLKAFVDDNFPVFEENSFPPPDLLGMLVDLYFDHISCHYPLLHEPTVKDSIKAGQLLHDGPFGATILLVCAIGSRFIDDPRVLLEDSNHPHSAGWKWFSLVEGVRRLPFAPAKLHNLQVYAVCVVLQFLRHGLLTCHVLHFYFRC